jgi:hypothetical protein
MANFIYNLIYGKKDKEISDLKSQIDNLNSTIDALVNSNKIKIPEVKGTITISQVNTILTTNFPNADIHLSDSQYSMTTLDEASKFTMQSLISTKKYETEVHDCDNFSYALCGYWSDSLKSFPLGIAWTATHAFNVGIFLDSNGSNHLYIIEPQTNAFMEVKDAQKDSLYKNIKVIMI